MTTSVVVAVGSAGRPAQNFQITLCCPSQIFPTLHFSNDILNRNTFFEPLALGGLNWIKSPPLELITTTLVTTPFTSAGSNGDH